MVEMVDLALTRPLFCKRGRKEHDKCEDEFWRQVENTELRSIVSLCCESVASFKASTARLSMAPMGDICPLDSGVVPAQIINLAKAI